MATDIPGEMQTLNKKFAGGMMPAFRGLGVVAIKDSTPLPPYNTFAGTSAFSSVFAFLTVFLFLRA
jgi:hypothetical protein